MENSPTDEEVMDLSKPVKNVEEKWKMLEYFLQMRSLMRQHIDSFDFFINTEIKNIVFAQSNCEIRSDSDPKFFMRYVDVFVGEPTNFEENEVFKQITPFECRLRDCTYAAPIFVSVRFTRGRQIVNKSGICIGYIPIMLHCSRCLLRGKSEAELGKLKECPYDPGGYFIVKGTERIILMHEQLSKNRVIIELNKHNDVCASITSSTHDRKSKAYIFMKHKKIYLKQSTLNEDIPIIVVLKAMGLESDQEIIQLVGTESKICDMLLPCFEECTNLGIFTQLQALKFIGKSIQTFRPGVNPIDNKAFGPGKGKTEEDTLRILAYVVLNHVPVKQFNFRMKAIYVSHIIRRIIYTHLDRSLLDDKDYYGNKRIELAGSMISLLFEDLFKKFNADLKRQADMVLSKPNRAAAFDITKMIRTDTITNGFIHAMSTGNWTLKRFKMDRAGVTQVLSRLSFISSLGMMTRINSQFEKTRKVSGPRALQPSQWGMLCPCDTPEGEACGLVKNLALLSHVTTDVEVEPIKRVCFDLGMVDICLITGAELSWENTYLVLLNGLIIGAHGDPIRFVNWLRLMRRNGMVGEFVSVYLHENQRAVHIASDGGRLCRPLIIVEKGKSCLKQIHVQQLTQKLRTISDLMKQGIIEYVDVNEENNCYISIKESDLTPQHTHLEIDPLTILGIVAGLIPYPHHNQSPRNTYQCAMGKQAMGTIGLNQYERIETLIYAIIYPQKPMVKTRVLDLIHFDQVPGGQNVTLGVMSYSGYDIEDAVILNKGSIDRGFGRCTVLKKAQVTIKRYVNGTTDRTVGPPTSESFPKGENDISFQRFKHIDIDGIVKVGEQVNNGAILVNREIPISTPSTSDNSQTKTLLYTSTPLKYKGPAPSIVDRVMVTADPNDLFNIKVLLRQCRRPEIGDKFSSRHGQKGVCGMIINQEDIPFNDSGICPDLIMNPHGFPSRMTVGKMIELIAGKAGVLEGRQGYGTAFGEDFGNADKVLECSKILVKHGFSYVGKDFVTSGTSGTPLLSYIFMGPLFYQKLKHMVMDKMHARATGPRTMLTRQPTEGRSRDGGLRLGEMERDCLVGYGASNLILERLMLSSDVFSASVCERCGLLVYPSWCQNCRSGDKIATVKMPYACKLLFQELQSMNIAPKLKLQDF